MEKRQNVGEKFVLFCTSLLIIGKKKESLPIQLESYDNGKFCCSSLLIQKSHNFTSKLNFHIKADGALFKARSSHTAKLLR